MLNEQPVCIVGGGIGGLACAVALAARGAKVRVLEQAPEISEVGAGLQITPNGVAVLDALGLGAGLRDIAIPASAVEMKDYAQGARVVRMDLSRHGAGRSYLLLHRADLINLLADAARAAGVEIVLNKQVTDVAPSDDGVLVTFADGQSEQVKMLIAADGLHSRLRAVLNGEAKPFFTGQVAWRALVPATDKTTRDVNVHMGPGRHIVTYPLRDGTLTNIVATQERPEWAAEGWNHPGDPDALRRAFSMFGPDVQNLLKQVETVNVWGLFRHPVASLWHGQNCALLGDAAHPTLPFLAQGANMALEDAWVLADCLASLPVEQAMPTYQNRRRDRVVRVINAANANARNYHLRNPAIRFAAHSALRMIGAIAPAQILGKFNWVHQYDVTKG